MSQPLVRHSSCAASSAILKPRQLKFPYITTILDRDSSSYIYLNICSLTRVRARRRLTIMMTQIGYVLRVCFCFWVPVACPLLLLSSVCFIFRVLFSCGCCCLPTDRAQAGHVASQACRCHSSLVLHVILFVLLQTFYAALPTCVSVSVCVCLPSIMLIKMAINEEYLVTGIRLLIFGLCDCSTPSLFLKIYL